MLALATALAASAYEANHETSGTVVAANGRGPAKSTDLREVNGDAGTRATVTDAAGKSDEAAASPNSSGFTLLGLSVVLVGVIARQPRRFRRSGTILLR